jgi:uncharacterized protein (TIGR02099 family)
MKFSPFFSAFPRWVATGLIWLVATVTLIFATLVAAMYFWLLPHIADYRDTLADLMSRALGQRVTLEAVSGTWQQTRPQFILRGVQLYDQQNRPALYLEQLDAAFSWRSLLVLQPRFTRLELTAPALTVRRARDGHFYVGGIPINPADPRSGFSDWLLKQGKVHIRRATLAWRDEVRQAPMLVLRELDFTLENSYNRHLIQVQATPPAYLSMPLILQAELKGRSVSDLKTWSGVVGGEVSGISLSPCSQWIDLPYSIERGWGAANLRLEINRGRLDGIAVGLNVRDVTATLKTGLPPLQLAHLRGSASWKRSGIRQQVELEVLKLSLPGGKDVPGFNAGFAWEGNAREAHANNLNLTAVQSVWPSLPFPLAARDSLQDFEPRGRIDALQLRWQGDRPSAAGFNLATRVSNLELAARGTRPGIANLSGSIRGDEKSGVFELQSKALQVDLPEIFREPKVTLDTLQAHGTWKKRAQGMLFSLSQLDFANADAAGSGKGSYESVNGHAGKIDLTARLTRGNGTAVYRYLPKHIHDNTVAWVKRAVLAGTSNDTQLILKGDLAQFPFVDDQGGLFKVTVGVQGAVLDYAVGWPRIEGAAGQLIFHGSRMEVHADQGRIFNARLGPVSAVIPNLHTHEQLIEISGQAVGEVQDFIRYANQSPVGTHLKGITEKLDGSGPMALALNLKIPLHHSHDTTLGGRLSFRGDTLLAAALPRIEQVKGDIVFTQNGLSSQGLSAQILGGPVSISASSRDGRAQLQAQGRASATGLTSWLGKPWGSRLSGETHWRGQLMLGQEHPQMRIESDLVGLESRLPAPLNKPASQPLPLLVTRLPQTGNAQLIEIQLGRTLGAIWETTADNRITRGELRFGGVAKLPQEPGLHLTGSGRGLALSEWMRLMPENNEAADLPISFIDLSFGTLDLMGRHFPDVRVQGRTRGGQLHLSVMGRDMNGTLTYRPAERTALASTARVSAQFKQLTIPAVEGAATEGATTNVKASDVPVLDLSVEDFRLKNHSLGRLEALAHGTVQGLVIDNLQLTHADSVMHMSGLWRDTGTGETQAKLQVDVLDAGKMLNRFGFKDAVKRGSANLEGEVTWEGGPVDFGFQTLAGTLNFRAKNGQFLKVDPGVAKLLGVLSLQALPRRLSFDFRDIFNDGFAFDEISATMRIARGVVYSDDFRMKGPAAKVSMSGVAKLADETVQLRVKVTPKLSEGVAVAGALIGGPIAGLGVLAAQKLFRDPFEEAGSREYMVTGPWREPEVTKLTKTRKQDAPKDNAPKDSDG